MKVYPSLLEFWVPMATIAPVVLVAVVVELRQNMRSRWTATGRGARMVVFLSFLYQLVAVGGSTVVSIFAIYYRGNLPRVMEGVVTGVMGGAVVLIAFSAIFGTWRYLHPDGYAQEPS